MSGGMENTADLFLMTRPMPRNLQAMTRNGMSSMDYLLCSSLCLWVRHGSFAFSHHFDVVSRFIDLKLYFYVMGPSYLRSREKFALGKITESTWIQALITVQSE